MNSEPTSQINPAEQTQPDNLCLSLPEQFTALRQWPDEVIVEPGRLAWDLWGDTEGDITAAYSGDKRPKILTFVHEGQRFTNMGGSEYSVHCYPLLLPENYKGTGKKPYSYEGETVIHDKQTFTLGAKVAFSSRPLTVDEEISLLRRKYAYGGHFVAGKTYQEMLLTFQEDERNPDHRKTAIARELARDSLPKTQPEMLAALGKLSRPLPGHTDMLDISQLGLPGM
jgi:hypothetical protein